MNFLRFKFVIGLALSCCCGDIYAVDMQPVSKSLENEDERYSLVGVIAEGGGKGGSGIAVIKDTQNRKTYTIKVGEPIPADPALRLMSVRRSQAVLEGQGKTIYVGVSSVGYNDDKPTSSQTATMEVESGLEAKPSRGLFERWYEGMTSPVLAPTAEALNHRRIETPEPELDDDIQIDLDDDVARDADETPTEPAQYKHDMRELMLKQQSYKIENDATTQQH